MLEGVEDTKEWLHEQRLQRRVSLIEMWRDGENEELEEQTGEHHDDFREMMEQIREEYSSDEMTDRVLQNELEQEGFDSVIALQILDAVEESASGRDDLVFLKRNTTPEELEELVEHAVELYMGQISPEDLQEFIQGFDETKNEESTDSETKLARDLFNRANRFMQASIRVSIEETGGIEALKNETRSSANMSEERVDAIFRPIESNLEALQRYYIYYHIKNIEAGVSNINNKIDNIDVKITELVRKMD
jgi:hypothetical protein